MTEQEFIAFVRSLPPEFIAFSAPRVELAIKMAVALYPSIEPVKEQEFANASEHFTSDPGRIYRAFHQETRDTFIKTLQHGFATWNQARN